MNGDRQVILYSRQFSYYHWIYCRDEWIYHWRNPVLPHYLIKFVLNCSIPSIQHLKASSKWNSDLETVCAVVKSAPHGRPLTLCDGKLWGVYFAAITFIGMEIKYLKREMELWTASCLCWTKTFNMQKVLAENAKMSSFQTLPHYIFIKCLKLT